MPAVQWLVYTSIVKQSLLQSISKQLLAGFLILTSQTTGPVFIFNLYDFLLPHMPIRFFFLWRAFIAQFMDPFVLTCTRILCCAWMLSLLSIISTLKKLIANRNMKWARFGLTPLQERHNTVISAVRRHIWITASWCIYCDDAEISSKKKITRRNLVKKERQIKNHPLA